MITNLLCYNVCRVTLIIFFINFNFVYDISFMHIEKSLNN